MRLPAAPSCLDAAISTRLVLGARAFVSATVRVASLTSTAEVPWDAGMNAEIYPMSTGQMTVDMVGVVAADPAAVTRTRGSVIGRFDTRCRDT